LGELGVDLSVTLALDTSVMTIITGLAAVSTPAKTFTFATVVGSDTAFRRDLGIGRGLNADESRDKKQDRERQLHWR
jgi:fructose-1-phosphate kinase PfkB-like protein